jgi:Nif-specific regulatory protein
MRYHWPGNVRELENACERTIQTCTCGTVRTGCVAAAVLFGAADGTPFAPPAEAAADQQPRPISLDERLKEVESNLIGWALKVSDGNKSKAAELLNIKRSTLGDRIARCGLVEAREPREAPEPQAAIA